MTFCAGWMALVVQPAAVPATSYWMSEEAMRAAFIGKTLDGHYGNGVKWTETYLLDGRLDYREPSRAAAGHWYFRNGNVFCTFYDAAHRPDIVGGCWTTLQSGPNCYEFYFAPLNAGEPSRPGEDRNSVGWNARGWRQGEPQTCEPKPSV
jgi:hypothetical protein